MMKSIKIILFITFMSLAGFADTGKLKDTSKGLDAVKKIFLQELNGNGKTRAWDSINMAHGQQLLNEQFKTQMAQERDNQRTFEDNDYAMKHRWRSFDFQFFASEIIFLLVILIVLTGIIFSGIQFRYTLKNLQLKEKILDTAKHNDAGQQAIDLLKTDLELGKEGIKVNSSVLGVIILVISIAFFYLYLIYVYPINYIASGNTVITSKTDTLPKAGIVKQLPQSKTDKPTKQH